MTLPSDLEILLTRTFDAPRRLVFEAMTSPEHVRRWWGPRYLTMTDCQMDVRVGGSWRFAFRKPGDDVEHVFKGEYREIVPPERVVQTFIYDIDFIRDYPAIETMTLEEEADGRCDLRVLVLHATKDARGRPRQLGHGAGRGRGAADRLEEFLRTLA